MRICLYIAFFILPCLSSAQYTWKLEKDQDDIKVFSSPVPNSIYKAIRVECILPGNFDKLIKILTDVSNFTTWIYHAKNCSLVHRISDLEYVYFTETLLPWPMSNREGRIHVEINTDSIPEFITITGHTETDFVPTDGAEAIAHYSAHWKVRMPTEKTISIEYLLELDPGGSIPAWVANMFAANGPFETFSNLGRILKD